MVLLYVTYVLLERAMRINKSRCMIGKYYRMRLDIISNNDLTELDSYWINEICTLNTSIYILNSNILYTSVELYVFCIRFSNISKHHNLSQVDFKESELNQCHQKIRQLEKRVQQLEQLVKSYEERKMIAAECAKQMLFSKLIDDYKRKMENDVREKEILKLEMDRMRQKLKNQNREQERWKNLMQVKQQMIENYEWERRVMLEEKQELEQQIESMKVKEGGIKKREIGRVDDLEAIICESFENSANVSEVEYRFNENIKNFFGKNVRSELEKDAVKQAEAEENVKTFNELDKENQYLKFLVTDLEKKLVFSNSDKEQLLEQINLLKSRQKEQTYEKLSQEKSKQNRKTVLLGQKCLLLEKQIEKLTKKLLGYQIIIQQKEKYSSPLTGKSPRFPKSSTRLFSRQNESSCLETR